MKEIVVQAYMKEIVVQAYFTTRFGNESARTLCGQHFLSGIFK